MPNVDIDALLNRMTLVEKIGQMTQVEKNSISLEDVRQYGIGSILSGGGGNPPVNDPQNWAAMTRPFLEAALETRLRIPLIYGADCVHGHGNMYGATVFPHNIGLGAADDEALVEEIGYVTGREMLAVHVHWNFAPCLAVPQDARWGRTYEGYAGDVEIVSRLGAAYVRGLQRAGVAACIKHYVGDGGAEWGTRPHASWATFWEQNG
ncbi:MAG: glycoside hydrolase family 3 protein, partial [Anaerolinea sp.]|nr:glycoside hydrolase family 3 protein [Anaerolinea sp.]